MALQKTKDGKVDKRTKEYKEMCENLAKARAKQKASTTTGLKKKTSTLKRNQDGTVDKRTKEGKAIAERMAKARAAQGSLKNRLKKFFS